jgi:hypothetical protein
MKARPDLPIGALAERARIGQYACVAREKGGALSGTRPARYQSVQLRCAFCEQLVEARNGAAGKAFVCFDCVDAINRLRAESPGSSVEL